MFELYQQSRPHVMALFYCNHSLSPPTLSISQHNYPLPAQMLGWFKPVCAFFALKGYHGYMLNQNSRLIHYDLGISRYRKHEILSFLDVKAFSGWHSQGFPTVSHWFTCSASRKYIFKRSETIRDGFLSFPWQKFNSNCGFVINRVPQSQRGYHWKRIFTVEDSGTFSNMNMMHCCLSFSQWEAFIVDRNLRGLFFRGDLVLFGLFSVWVSPHGSSQEQPCGLHEARFCISTTPLRLSWIIVTLGKKSPSAALEF